MFRQELTRGCPGRPSTPRYASPMVLTFKRKQRWQPTTTPEHARGAGHSNNPRTT